VASKPWFAIGGIDPPGAAEVAAAGAERVAVVRAIRDARDPELAARAMRAVLETGAAAGGSRGASNREASVGPAR
jgi:thiamine-phosphate pyrophosphorylase